MFLLDPEYKDVDKNQLRQLNYSIADGIGAAIMGSLTSGVFLVGFALLLGASPVQIGILSSLPFFASVAQLIGSYFIESGASRKFITVAGASAARLLWVLIILVPLLMFQTKYAVWMVMALYALSNIFSSTSSVAWLSWTSDIVPRKFLGRFFSKRNIYLGAASILAGLLGGIFLDFWKINYPPLTGFVVLYAIAIFFGLVSTFFLIVIKDVPQVKHKVDLGRFGDLIKKPYKDRNFRKLVRFGLFWGFSIGIAAPFFIVYMLNVLGLDYLVVASLEALFVLSGLVSLRMWGRVVDRYGAKPVLIICSFLVALYPLFFIFISRADYLLLFPINLASGMAWAGVDFTTTQMVLRVSPKENKSVYLSSFAVAAGLAFAVAAIVGGVVASSVVNASYSIGVTTLYGLHILFFIALLLRLWSGTLVRGIYEPRSGNVDDVISHLKQDKAMSIFVNFYHVSKFSIGVATIPLVYSMKAIRHGRSLLTKTVRRNVQGTLRNLGTLVKAASKKIGRSKDLERIAANLKSLDKEILVMKEDVAATSDENVLKTIQDGAENLMDKISEIEQMVRKSGVERQVPNIRKMVKLAKKVRSAK
ncbi:MAG: MFS transporter [Candidatus Aenigmarchaeota archaeon]|nr:MFS transporter [Candidatus Aenigmarchaeota archaeon]